MPRGAGSLPTPLRHRTVMAKPLVRGSRWCLRLGSPLACATCMLIWCFFSVNRVPSQWIRNWKPEGDCHTGPHGPQRPVVTHNPRSHVLSSCTTLQSHSLWSPTYKVLLGVVPEVQQALGDRLAVLFPLACAEDHFREVPHPADYGDVGQLFLGQDLGVLKQEAAQRVREGGSGVTSRGCWSVSGKGRCSHGRPRCVPGHPGGPGALRTVSVGGQGHSLLGARGGRLGAPRSQSSAKLGVCWRQGQLESFETRPRHPVGFSGSQGPWWSWSPSDQQGAPGTLRSPLFSHL